MSLFELFLVFFCILRCFPLLFCRFLKFSVVFRRFRRQKLVHPYLFLQQDGPRWAPKSVKRLARQQWSHWRMTSLPPLLRARDSSAPGLLASLASWGFSLLPLTLCKMPVLGPALAAGRVLQALITPPSQHCLPGGRQRGRWHHIPRGRFGSSAALRQRPRGQSKSRRAPLGFARSLARARRPPPRGRV